jgi:acetylcholinesterase
MIQIADATPAPHLEKRILLPLAPLASDIKGAHILLNNDVDSSTTKRAFLLLSESRDYYEGMNACTSMGESKFLRP